MELTLAPSQACLSRVYFTPEAIAGCGRKRVRPHPAEKLDFLIIGHLIILDGELSGVGIIPDNTVTCCCAQWSAPGRYTRKQGVRPLGHIPFAVGDLDVERDVGDQPLGDFLGSYNERGRQLRRPYFLTNH